MHHLSVDQLQKIRWLIVDCGQQARQMASEPFQVFEKGVEDYVTNVDRTLDERLLRGLNALFPQDAVITEENFQSRQAFGEAYDRFWLVDPLDGTEDFIHRQLHYAVMVGLLQAHQPIAGWVYAPEFEQLYYGGPGWGLFQQVGDRPPEPLLPRCPAPPSNSFCPVIVGDRDQRNFGEAIHDVIPEAQFANIGSFGLKVMRVICGQAGLYVYLNQRVKLWDTAGPLALAQAAGLMCCDLDGQPLSFTGDAICPDTLAHRQTIVIGWPDYIEQLQPRLRAAVRQVWGGDRPDDSLSTGSD